MYKGYNIRFVKERIDFSRFDREKCHETDHTYVFDCTAVPPAIVEAYINRYMLLKQITNLYRIQRSRLRPGYVFVHFTMRDGKYVQKADCAKWVPSGAFCVTGVTRNFGDVQMPLLSLESETNVTINEF